MRQYGHQCPRWKVTATGPFSNNYFETDELASFVGQSEVRHRLPRLRRVLADIVLPQPIHELINRRLKLRTERPYRVGEGLSLCAKDDPCRGTERRLLRAIPRATSSSSNSPPVRATGLG